MDGSKLNECENKIPKLLNMTLTWPDLRANGSDVLDVSYGSTHPFIIIQEPYREY